MTLNSRLRHRGSGEGLPQPPKPPEQEVETSGCAALQASRYSAAALGTADGHFRPVWAPALQQISKSLAQPFPPPGSSLSAQSPGGLDAHPAAKSPGRRWGRLREAAPGGGCAPTPAPGDSTGAGVCASLQEPHSLSPRAEGTGRESWSAPRHQPLSPKQRTPPPAQALLWGHAPDSPKGEGLPCPSAHPGRRDPLS